MPTYGQLDRSIDTESFGCPVARQSRRRLRPRSQPQAKDTAHIFAGCSWLDSSSTEHKSKECPESRCSQVSLSNRGPQFRSVGFTAKSAPSELSRRANECRDVYAPSKSMECRSIRELKCLDTPEHLSQKNTVGDRPDINWDWVVLQVHSPLI